MSVDQSWVYSTQGDPTSYHNGLGNISLYNSANSSETFKDLPDSYFSIIYMSDTGTFEGPMGTDLMTIGTTTPVREAFGLVETPDNSKDLTTLRHKESWVLALEMRASPVCLLAIRPSSHLSQHSKDHQLMKRSLSLSKIKTWLENVLPTLNEKLFTLTINSEGSRKWNFGYIDSAQYTGSITYAPLGACSQSGWVRQHLIVITSPEALTLPSGLLMD